MVGTVQECMKSEVHLKGEGTYPDVLCVKYSSDY